MWLVATVLNSAVPGGLCLSSELDQALDVILRCGQPWVWGLETLEVLTHLEMEPEPQVGLGVLARAQISLLVSAQLVTGLPSAGAKATTWRTDLVAAGLDCVPSEAFGQL